MTIAYDINSEKWLSIWKLNSLANPNYYETMKKYFVNLCLSLGLTDLADDFLFLIADRIEKPMGASFEAVLFAYKNLPALNSMTKSRNPDYPNEYVYKYELKNWLDSVETWVFEKLVMIEPLIRFRESQKIM